MLTAIKHHQWVSCAAQFLKSYFDFFTDLFQTRYRIEEICAARNYVLIRCLCSRSYIKTTINDALNTYSIVSHLPSLHACWLGYYYALSEKIGEKKGGKQPCNFKLQMKNGQFKIISFEHKTNMLAYQNLKTRKMYNEKVTQVVQDKFIISRIDPTQACYIGMQAGFCVNKHGEAILSEKCYTPVLKVVE